MVLSLPQVVPPTRQCTDDGRGVPFYVKALYDYTATIPEEFDFQAGDIAVAATPEDVWWSGELLDEVQRVPGRHILEQLCFVVYIDYVLSILSPFLFLPLSSLLCAFFPFSVCFPVCFFPLFWCLICFP